MRSPATSEQLTGSESLLWTIERDPVLRSTVVVLFLLDGKPDVDLVRQRISAASEEFPRLHQRITTSRTGPPRWSDAGPVDLDHHVQHIALPRRSGLRELLDLGGSMAGEAFDPARPLWRVVLVDRPGGAALILKVHHALTDGVGGVGLLSLLTDPPAGRRRPRRPPPADNAARPALVAAVARLGDLAMHPTSTIRAVPEVARSVGKMLAPAGRACSPLMTGRGVDRHLATIDVPRDGLEAAAHVAGQTLNDAFLAAVVGGMASYHRRHGVALERLRITMPISTRHDGDRAGGNRFVPARFVVPVTTDDPVARMRVLGEISHRWRHEPAVGLASGLADVLELLPGQVTTSLFSSMLKGVDVVATNVPGLARPSTLGGAAITRMYGFAPPAGAAVNVALVTHADVCCIGVVVDSAAIGDPDQLVECLRAAFTDVVGVGSKRSRDTTDVRTT